MATEVVMIKTLLSVILLGWLVLAVWGILTALGVT